MKLEAIWSKQLSASLPLVLRVLGQDYLLNRTPQHCTKLLHFALEDGSDGPHSQGQRLPQLLYAGHVKSPGRAFRPMEMCPEVVEQLCGEFEREVAQMTQEGAIVRGFIQS